MFNRFTKILYFTLLASVGLYWAVLELVAGSREPVEVEGVKPMLLLLGGGLAVAVLYIRFSRFPPLLFDPNVELAQRLARLRFYYILCYILSEAVALYGFCLRLLGGTRAEAAPFFLAAVALFLLCYPRPPESGPPVLPGSPGGQG